MAERCTCRDRDGNARLIDGINIMMAIERLARIEEKALGVLIAEPTETQRRNEAYTIRRWGPRE